MGGNKEMKLTYIHGKTPEVEDSLVFLFNQWDNTQAYLLNKDGEIWLSFRIDEKEKLALLRALLKQWIIE